MADKQGATGVPNILLPGGGSSRRSRPQQQQQDYRASTASEQAPDYTSVYEQPIGNARPMSSMTDALPDESPPPYGEVAVQNGEISGDANLAADGRINININSASLRFAEFIAPSLQRNSSVKGRPVTVHKSRYADEPPAYVPPGLGLSPEGTPPPRMNIVIQIVGSRGDVQPFVALGKVLKEQFNHRVRIATHGDFKAFVEDNGLEFFCIGGNPAELMAFMVKNPGLVPGMGSLASGEIGRRRKGVQEMIEGAWRSCFEPGDGNSAPLPPRGTPEEKAHQVDFEFYQKPFVADAIIANPPSFAHIHVAEKMGIPLHLMFTMPWSPTRSFPHPLANIQSSNAKDVGTTNTVSYALVEMLTWQGLADVINKFRTERLGLEALDAVWTPGLVNRLQIPYTYCWSPALIPKPEDWGDNIDISGFFMLDLASDYTPPADLEAFLNAGEPPVYIGFGSIVVDDPNALTNLIFEAVRKTGVRALVSKGWGGLGGDSLEVPPNVFMLGNCPHDWLFKRVSAVVHHGGAGTSSAGIHAGVPTAIVPFFGDQPFWGAMIARAGAGPDPIPFAQLTASKLADALVFCARDDIRAKAEELGARIRVEKGTQKGAEYFHKHLYYEDLRCALIPDRAAVWRTNQTKIRLSAVATSLLVEQGLLSWSDVSLYRPRDYNTEAEPWEPFSGITASFVNDCANIAYAIGDLPYSSIKAGFNKGKSASQHNRRVRRGIDSTLMAAPSSSKLDDFEGKAIVGSYHENQKPASSSSSRTSISRKPVSSEKMLASPPPQPSRTSTDQSSLTQPSPSRPAMRERRFSSDSESSMESLTDMSYYRKMDVVCGAVKETGIEATRGIRRIIGVGMKSPMNMSLGLAKGFRNAPKLYNDPTMRKAEKVRDFKSGLRVAGKEFGLGIYDGCAGLIKNPREGAKTGGSKGLVKGIGKGLGGFLLKPASGFWALPAYTFQGAYLEIRGAGRQSYTTYFEASRIAQGQEELQEMAEDRKLELMLLWRAVEAEASSKKSAIHPSRLRQSAAALIRPRTSSSTLSVPRSNSGPHSRSSTSSTSSQNTVRTNSWNDRMSRATTSSEHQPSGLAPARPHGPRVERALPELPNDDPSLPPHPPADAWNGFYSRSENGHSTTADTASHTTHGDYAEASSSREVPIPTNARISAMPGRILPLAWAAYSPEELDAVIADTVRQSSRGNAMEDAAIEQVIRENVDEMKRLDGVEGGARNSLIETVSEEEYQRRIERVIEENTGSSEEQQVRTALRMSRDLAAEEAELERARLERDAILREYVRQDSVELPSDRYSRGL